MLLFNVNKVCLFSLLLLFCHSTTLAYKRNEIINICPLKHATANETETRERKREREREREDEKRGQKLLLMTVQKKKKKK